MDESYVIYLLWDPRNGEIRYVGQTKDLKSRFSNHRTGHGTKCHCRNWELSLIGEGLRCEIAVVEEGLTSELANDRERWWITYGRQYDWPLTNHTDGGGGAPGRKMSSEAKQKLRLANLGNKHSPETIEKLRRHAKLPETIERRRGRTLTPESRNKLSQAKRGHAVSPETRERIGQKSRGRVPSHETREKLSRSSKGRKWSPATREQMKQRETTPETREKISRARLGMKFSAETREKLRISHLGKKLSPGAVEKRTRAVRGSKRSPETCKKISLARLAWWARQRQEREARDAEISANETERRDESSRCGGNG